MLLGGLVRRGRCGGRCGGLVLEAVLKGSWLLVGAGIGVAGVPARGAPGPGEDARLLIGRGPLVAPGRRLPVARSRGKGPRRVRLQRLWSRRMGFRVAAVLVARLRVSRSRKGGGIGIPRTPATDAARVSLAVPERPAPVPGPLVGAVAVRAARVLIRVRGLMPARILVRACARERGGVLVRGRVLVVRFARPRRGVRIAAALPRWAAVPAPLTMAGRLRGLAAVPASIGALIAHASNLPCPGRWGPPPGRAVTDR